MSVNRENGKTQLESATEEFAEYLEPRIRALQGDSEDAFTDRPDDLITAAKLLKTVNEILSSPLKHEDADKYLAQLDRLSLIIYGLMDDPVFNPQTQALLVRLAEGVDSEIEKLSLTEEVSAGSSIVEGDVSQKNAEAIASLDDLLADLNSGNEIASENIQALTQSINAWLAELTKNRDALTGSLQLRVPVRGEQIQTRLNVLNDILKDLTSMKEKISAGGDALQTYVSGGELEQFRIKLFGLIRANESRSLTDAKRLDAKVVTILAAIHKETFAIFVKPQQELRESAYAQFKLGLKRRQEERQQGWDKRAPELESKIQKLETAAKVKSSSVAEDVVNAHDAIPRQEESAADDHFKELMNNFLQPNDESAPSADVTSHHKEATAEVDALFADEHIEQGAPIAQTVPSELNIESNKKTNKYVHVIEQHIQILIRKNREVKSPRITEMQGIMVALQKVPNDDPIQKAFILDQILTNKHNIEDKNLLPKEDLPVYSDLQPADFELLEQYHANLLKSAYKKIISEVIALKIKNQLLPANLSDNMRAVAEKDILNAVLHKNKNDDDDPLEFNAASGEKVSIPTLHKLIFIRYQMEHQSSAGANVSAPVSQDNPNDPSRKVKKREPKIRTKEEKEFFNIASLVNSLESLLKKYQHQYQAERNSVHLDATPVTKPKSTKKRQDWVQSFLNVFNPAKKTKTVAEEPRIKSKKNSPY